MVRVVLSYGIEADIRESKTEWPLSAHNGHSCANSIS
jgi:hypothetical protein